MSGYTREFLSIEQALKEVVRKIDKEDIKNATGKSESFFENVVMKMTSNIIFI